jgi:hypothetical protein
MLRVTRVQPLGQFRLELGFTDGSIREVDLRDELHGEVFEPLKDPEFFRKVFVNSETNTIECPNDADFAPEFLLGIGTAVRQIA